MATDSADHISGDQEVSGSAERKQRLPKGKQADGVYPGCAAARAPTIISSVWQRLKSRQSRGKAVRIRRFEVHVLIVVSVMKKEVSSLEVRRLI